MADEKNNQDDEPSIEEILSSIRDIISEDDEEGVQDVVTVDMSADAPKEDDFPENSLVDKVFAKDQAESAAIEDDDDIIELTDISEDNDNVVIDEADKEDPLAGINLDHPDGDDLDVTEEEPDEMDNDAVDNIFNSVDVEEETADAESGMDVFDTITTEEADVEAIEPVTEEALIDKVAESATVGAMVKLAENIAVSRTKEGVTLEDIVKQSLRPMLKDWLDENLPTLIERLVSQELERLANKAAGK